MKIDELRVLARVVRDTVWARLPATEAPRLAKGVLELLGASWPCGWPEPEARTDRHIYWESLGAVISADEARGIAIGLLRAAEEAER